MNALTSQQLETLWAFIEAHRATHLWFWRCDHIPETGAELRLALQFITKERAYKPGDNCGIRAVALLLFQRGICQFLAQDRKQRGASYVARAMSLKEAPGREEVHFHEATTGGAWPRFK